MVVYLQPQGQANLSLREHDVGAASETITYPAIVQCFAIAGWTGGTILGAHISPDFSEEDIDDSFGALDGLGGRNVMYWYVVGPFIDHFAVGKSPWRSVQAIKKTFRKHFENKAATHMILDASAERHAKRTTEGLDYSFSAINVQARIAFVSVQFYYNGWGGPPRPWVRFDNSKFVLF